MNDHFRLLEPAEGFLALGMCEDAWEELDSLPSLLRVQDAVIEMRIRICQRMGKWEMARILAESMAKKSPEHPQWWIHWAYSLRREKSISDARAVLLEAAGHHPNVALIPYNLACYQCVEGDLMGAKAFLRQAFKMDDKLKQVALEDPDLEPIFG
jgi:Flp pilus assembly protein TadD